MSQSKYIKPQFLPLFITFCHQQQPSKQQFSLLPCESWEFKFCTHKSIFPCHCFDGQLFQYSQNVSLDRLLICKQKTFLNGCITSSLCLHLSRCPHVAEKSAYAAFKANQIRRTKPHLSMIYSFFWS